jgi:hypothetical protein
MKYVILLLALFLVSCGKNEAPAPAAVTMAASAPDATSEQPQDEKPVKKKKKKKLKNHDAIVDQLSQATVTLNAPHKAKYGVDFPVQLTIQPDIAREVILKSLKVDGDVTSDDIEISRIVEVELFAPDFNVVARAPKRQAVSSSEPTEWIWDLTPTVVGVTDIHVSVMAVVKVDDEKAERLVRAYTHDIKVHVNPQAQVWDLLKKYWQWVFSSILAPLAIWAWKRWKKEREKPAEFPEA